MKYLRSSLFGKLHMSSSFSCSRKGMLAVSAEPGEAMRGEGQSLLVGEAEIMGLSECFAGESIMIKGERLRW